MNEITNATLFIHIMLTIAGFTVCMFISFPCAVILLFISLTTFIFYLVTFKKRKNVILNMCDEIDKIMRETEAFSISDYDESELSILASEINKMTVKLREQNLIIKSERDVQKEAMEDISHQLRTPLTSMVLIIDLLRNPELDKNERRQYINELNQLNNHMNWLIDTLLSLSRLEAGAVNFITEQVNCRELLNNISERFMISAEVKGIELKLNTEGETLISCDVKYTSEAIGNLIKNCIEYTPEGGEVVISCSDNALYTAIVITDNGPGFSENDLPHIFDRFYKTTDRESSGFGIGLAYAKKVIASQNGSLRAMNTKTHGAKYEIRFYKTIV